MKSQYGECIVFESARHFPKPTQASGREAQLSLMVYNDAKDTMGGFNQLFTGLNGIKKTFTRIEYKFLNPIFSNVLFQLDRAYTGSTQVNITQERLTSCSREISTDSAFRTLRFFYSFLSKK